MSKAFDWDAEPKIAMKKFMRMVSLRTSDYVTFMMRALPLRNAGSVNKMELKIVDLSMNGGRDSTNEISEMKMFYSEDKRAAASRGHEFLCIVGSHVLEEVCNRKDEATGFNNGRRWKIMKKGKEEQNKTLRGSEKGFCSALDRKTG